MRVSAPFRHMLMACAVLVAAAVPARGQVGSTTDIIMGTVTGFDTTPVVGRASR